MDFLVEMGKTKWVRSAFEKLDLPLSLPSEIEREAGPETASPLEGRWVIMGGAHEQPAKEAARACAEAGAGFVVPGSVDYPACLSDMGVTAAAEKRRDLAAERVDVCIFDATGLEEIMQIDELFSFLKRWTPRINRSGRVLILAPAPGDPASPGRHALLGALGGLVRAFSKEVGPEGITVHLVLVPPVTGGYLAPLVRFIASRRSAFITGQTWRISEIEGAGRCFEYVRSLEKKVALVTGAARGIGAAITRSLAQEGAEVVLVDVPERSRELADTASRTAGMPLVVDITWPRAPSFIAGKVKKKHGKLDILVHNAGVYLDRRVTDMSPDDWYRVYNINLASVVRLTQALDCMVESGGRILGVGSIAGLAGIGGHTCYSGAKAGLMGYLQSLAGALKGRGITANAIAAGYIHTALTAGLSRFKREMGLRMSGMVQGGIPEDIGNLAAFLAGPGAGGLTGQIIRACGGSLIGA